MKITDQDSLNLKLVEVINIPFIVDEIFTGEIQTIKSNNENTLKVIKEKSERETRI